MSSFNCAQKAWNKLTHFGHVNIIVKTKDSTELVTRKKIYSMAGLFFNPSVFCWIFLFSFDEEKKKHVGLVREQTYNFVTIVTKDVTCAEANYISILC